MIGPWVDGKPIRSLTVAARIPPSDQTAIQRQIDATDRQIDQLVYELYGLTDDEIKVVEEATKVETAKR